MLIDLHVHCRPFTKSALSMPRETIEHAKKRGIEGLSLVSKGYIESRRAHQDAVEMFGGYGVRLFPGAEIETTRGPLLVYGSLVDHDLRFDGPVEVLSLIDWVHENGGAVVVPYLLDGVRGDLLTEVVEGGLWDWWVRVADCLELTFGDDRGNDDLAMKIGHRLDKRIIFGSDAHYSGRVGRNTKHGMWATSAPYVESVDELVGWLRCNE